MREEHLMIIKCKRVIECQVLEIASFHFRFILNDRPIQHYAFEFK